VLDAQLIVREDEAARLAVEWDALAVALGEPLSAPAWMLAWWRHVAPPSAELRIVAVRDRGELVGLVPLHVDRARRATARCYRLLAYDMSSSIAPLARPERVREVAAATTRLLSPKSVRPELLELAPLSASSPWPLALRERWPARMRPLVYRRELHVAPTVSLANGSFQAWLEERGARFRANARRYRKLFAQEGGVYRRADASTVEADLATFARLHASRWEGLGHSRLVALGERLPAFLGDVARNLGDERFRLLMLEIDGEAICADLWVAAGGEVTGVNIGWDERHKRLSPPRLAFLAAIEDAYARGERQLNLGWGRVDYKQGYTTTADAVAWDLVLPPGSQLARAVARTAPGILRLRAREHAHRILAPQQLEWLRALRGAGGAPRVAA